jgi:hypothetical protein
MLRRGEVPGRSRDKSSDNVTHQVVIVLPTPADADEK